MTRFLSFGLGLSVTGIEADPALVTMASKFDRELLWTLEKEKQKKVMCLFAHSVKGGFRKCQSTEPPVLNSGGNSVV